jgi:DHA2 family methylenomycin A resistance protein-like MFS transporter
MVAGFLVCGGGFLWLRLLDVQTAYWMMVPGFFLVPAGMGTAVPAMTTALLASVEKKWSGTASGVLNTARQAGGTVGVAAFGALVGQHHETIVAGLHRSVSICAGLLLLAAAISFFGIRHADSVKSAGDISP